MRLPSRGTLGVLGTGLAIGMLAAMPVAAQSSQQSQSQSKPAAAAPTHWGWFVPKAPAKPAPKAAPKAPAQPGQAAKGAPVRKTVSEGGATAGGRPTVTSTVTETGTSGGVGATAQRVSIPGINGGSRTLVDEETQTIRINDHTTQTIKKTYGQDPSGNRELIAIEKTDTTDLGGGKSQAKSTLSQIDADGQFNVTRREVSQTVPTGPHSSVTNTTVYTPGMSGGLDPSQKIEVTNSSDKTTEHTARTLQTPDGNGRWMTSKKTVTVVHKQGKAGQTEEKTLYSPDANGNLTVARRVVTRDWKAKDGKEHQEVSTYATTPGGTLTSQGTPLTLMQRVYTVKKTRPNGAIETRQQTEERSLVSPSTRRMMVTGSVISVATPTKTGEMKTQTRVLTDDGNGQLRQVSVFGGQAPKPEPATEAKPANGKAQGKKPATNKSGTKKQNQKQ